MSITFVISFILALCFPGASAAAWFLLAEIFGATISKRTLIYRSSFCVSVPWWRAGGFLGRRVNLICLSCCENSFYGLVCHCCFVS